MGDAEETRTDSRGPKRHENPTDSPASGRDAGLGNDAVIGTDEERTRRIQAEDGFLGHPRAMGTLSVMQLCWYFARLGMSSVLIFYLYTSGPQGLGLPKQEASQLVSLYFAVSVVCGVVGSYVADRILGPRRALLLSRAVEALGYACLSIPGGGVPAYAASQLLLCVAAMVGGRSAETLSGKLYARTDGSRRERGFAIIYVIQNIGSMSPLLVGAVALSAGYAQAFGTCAAMAAAGTLLMAVTDRAFFGPIGLAPDDPMPRGKRLPFLVELALATLAVVLAGAALLLHGIISVGGLSGAVSTLTVLVPVGSVWHILRSRKVSDAERGRVRAWIPLFVVNTITFVVWMQGTTTLSVYAETSVDRTLLGLEISPATFQAIPGMFAIVWGAVVSLAWAKLGRRRPSPVAKFSLGSMVWGLGPVLMALSFAVVPAGAKASPLWLIGFYGLIILGEAFTFSTGWSLSSAVAPRAFATQMVTVWGLSQSTGSALNTFVVTLWRPGFEIPYLLGLGVVAIGAGAWLLHRSSALTERMR